MRVKPDNCEFLAPRDLNLPILVSDIENNVLLF